MNLYSIYVDKHGGGNNPTIIKQGFSFWALALNFFWALYHKMWFVGGVIILVNFIILNLNLSPNIIFAEKVSQLFIFGFFASEIREFYAKQQGLELDDLILASSQEEAEVKYIMRISGEQQKKNTPIWD